jgi:hypothetical protein
VHLPPTGLEPTDWVAEAEALGRADTNGGLEAEGLARLGLALELTGRHREAVSAWDRAHRAHLASGNAAGAARCVYWIGFASASRGESAQAGAWATRLAELVAGEPPGSPGEALLLSAEGAARWAGGDAAGSAERFERAAAIAERIGDEDVQMLAAMGWGRALVALGDIEGGSPAWMG